MINIGFNSRLAYRIDYHWDEETKAMSFDDDYYYGRELGFVSINTDSYKLVDTDNIKEAIKHYNIVQYVDTRINEGVKDIDSLNKIVLSKLLKSNAEITVLENWMQIFTLLNMIVVTDAYPNREGVKDDKNMESPKI